MCENILTCSSILNFNLRSVCNMYIQHIDPASEISINRVIVFCNIFSNIISIYIYIYIYTYYDDDDDNM